MNKKLLSTVLAIIGLLMLYLPATYYGFIDYIIDNTIINMNLEKDSLETEKAALALYQGADLSFLPNWFLYILTALGFSLIYSSYAILRIGRKALTRAYWVSFEKFKF